MRSCRNPSQRNIFSVDSSSDSREANGSPRFVGGDAEGACVLNASFDLLRTTQGNEVEAEAIVTIPQYHGPARDAIVAACRWGLAKGAPRSASRSRPLVLIVRLRQSTFLFLCVQISFATTADGEKGAHHVCCVLVVRLYCRVPTSTLFRGSNVVVHFTRFRFCGCCVLCNGLS